MYSPHLTLTHVFVESRGALCRGASPAGTELKQTPKDAQLLCAAWAPAPPPGTRRHRAPAAVRWCHATTTHVHARPIRRPLSLSLPPSGSVQTDTRSESDGARGTGQVKGHVQRRATWTPAGSRQERGWHVCVPCLPVLGQRSCLIAARFCSITNLRSALYVRA
jgi:hypothetical protein